MPVSAPATASTIIRTRDLDVHVEQRGTRPEAVFIHGLGGDLHTWDDVWAATSSLPALRYDLRECGRTRSRSIAPFKHADDLLHVLDALALDNVDLVAVSMGAGIALNFTLDHPQRVRRLMLISPGLVGWEWSDEWRALWRPIAASAADGDMDTARRLWWQHPLFDSTRRTAAGEALRKSIFRMSAEQWLESNHVAMLPDVERLHQLSVPTLLLSGGQDLSEFRLIADLLTASAPHLIRADLPECGHLIHLEDPGDCARRLLDFLKKDPV